MSSPELRADSPLDPERAASGAEAPRAEPSPKKKREQRPKRRRRFGLFRWFLSLGAAVILAGGIATYGAYQHFAQDLPDYGWLAEYEPPQMSRVYAADSRLMAELAQERRIFVPIEAIPQRVQQAFISAEDQRFREHTGIDPLGILRAVIQAAEQYGSGRRMSGASTITQQVAKNMLVGADRSFTRKAREAILALRMEKALSKDRILELYLNEIFLGQQAYGVAAAAQVYFNKSLDELSIAGCEEGFQITVPSWLVVLVNSSVIGSGLPGSESSGQAIHEGHTVRVIITKSRYTKAVLSPGSPGGI